MFKVVIALFLAVLAGCSSTPPKIDTGIDPVTQQRVDSWKALIDSGSSWSDIKKLTSVNDFVNKFEFVDDIDHWQQEDYWATPLETLVTKGGDCEDFALAKYFTLSAMGMPEDKLRLTYVKALSINKAHMVVSYYENKKAIPLILDNLKPQIVPANERNDLIPAYSFNGSGLWLSNKNETDRYIDDASRISLWQQVKHRMNVEAANEIKMICLYQYYDLKPAVAQEKCS